jgi:hypothetical protein
MSPHNGKRLNQLRTVLPPPPMKFSPISLLNKHRWLFERKRIEKAEISSSATSVIGNDQFVFILRKMHYIVKGHSEHCDRFKKTIRLQGHYS